MQRACIFILAALAAAQAQEPGPVASVQIEAPRQKLIAGESLILKAISRDRDGLLRADDVAQWSVSNSALATVNPSSGELTGRNLGLVRVTARVGAITNSITIQILPKRVVVTPSSASVSVGDQVQFRAVALDRSDQPLPNVNFRWAAVSGNGGRTNTATIGADGKLAALAMGDIYVQALYDYGTSSPGFERQVLASAPVRIRARTSYRLTKLFSSHQLSTSGLPLLGKPTALVGNDRGQVVFNAWLGGLTHGPLLVEGGGQRLLAHAGIAGPLPYTLLSDFSTLALNNRGELLAQASVSFLGNTIYRLRDGEMEPVVFQNMPLQGTEFLTGPVIARHSINDAGDILVRAGYTVGAQRIAHTGLFRIPERGLPDEAVSTRTALPEFPTGFTFDGDFGIGTNGLVFFAANSGSRRAVYVSGYGSPPQKIIATGDALLNSTVARILPNIAMSEAGELALAVQLANNQLHLLRYTAARPSDPPRTAALRSFASVLRVSPTAGVLLLGDAGNGSGVYLWGDQSPRAVFLITNTRLNGKTVPAIDSATVSGSGEVTILARTQDHAMELFALRAGEDPVTLLRAGDFISASVPPLIHGILVGARTGPAHLLLGGGGGSSVFGVSPEGVKPLLLTGHRFAGIQQFLGATTSEARKGPSGEIYLTQTAGAGLVRLRDGQVEVALRPGFVLEDGAIVNAPTNVRANSRGDLLWQASTNRGDNRLILTRDGQSKVLLTNSANAAWETIIDGSAVIGWRDQTIDDAGRVMAFLTFRGGAGALYLYESGAWRLVAEPNVTEHRGAVVLNATQVKAGGETFYALFSLRSIGNVVVRYRDGKWETVLDSTDVLATGHQAGSIGSFDVNRNGDLFAVCNTNSMVLAVRRKDKFHHVHAASEATADGDLIIRVSEVDIRDDGAVYFLAMTAEEEYALYMAKPIE